MTRKLFYENSYTKSFTAVVDDCAAVSEGYAVILNQTAFYAEGGGQPSDTGRIGDAVVSDVEEIQGVIRHFTDKPLDIGASVQCEIDWRRRFSFMQQHTGEHIVSGIINSLFGFDNVGFHMGSEYVTLDINGTLDDDDIDTVEKAANAAVYKNVRVKAEYPPKDVLSIISYRSKKSLDGNIRIIDVPGFDKCACCGLHCAYTGEIGAIKIVTHQRYKGGVRIYMLCGERAMTDYSSKNKSVYAISALLSAKPYEITESVKKMIEENSLLKLQLHESKNDLFILKAGNIPPDTEKICLFEDSMSINDLRRFCLALCDRAEIAAVFSGMGNEYRYAIGSRERDVRIIGKELISVLNGKGGGKKELVQGTVYSTRESIEDFFK